MIDLHRTTKRLFDVTGLRFLKEYFSARGRNAVFIWIPKNAGTSIFNMLNAPQFKTAYHAKYRFAQRGTVTFTHMDYAELVSQGHVSRRFDRSAFKFAFSRNPYARAVSLYFYLRAAKCPGAGQESFLAFCRELGERGCDPIGLFNVNGTSQCNPQVRWIEHTRLDFLGSVETLEADLKRLFEELKLPHTAPLHLNQIERNDYSEYYCPESAEIVRAFYREDFEAFGYETTAPTRNCS
ncbi:MAG: sulfotransferase family 2 domain-containing protein [Verrucomicrobia bacterium]|nr:sulfotransferase family 2 domain-containing protein [Verrucomicrobiota bacterium]MDA1086030.1 sulfotransferase family 2 domain-containing protein [Verrucomicrobiota bacterium]